MLKYNLRCLAFIVLVTLICGTPHILQAQSPNTININLDSSNIQIHPCPSGLKDNLRIVISSKDTISLKGAKLSYNNGRETVLINASCLSEKKDTATIIISNSGKIIGWGVKSNSSTQIDKNPITLPFNIIVGNNVINITAAESNSSTNNEATEAKTTIFLPTVQEVENRFSELSSKKKLAQGIVESTNTFQVIYDMQRSIIMPKDGLVTDAAKTVSFMVQNINPYLYDVTINRDLITRPSGGDGNTTKTNSSTAANPSSNGIAQSKNDDLVKKASRLQPEMQQFLNEKKSQRSVNMDVLEAEISLIRENIVRVLGIEGEPTESAIIARIQKLATDKNKDTIESAISGAKLFTQITNINYTFSSAPIQARGYDAIRFRVTIKNKETQTPLVNDEPYTVDITNNWKWSASTGLIMTWLKDEKYVAVNKKILKEDDGPFTMGLAALSHFSGQFSSGFGMGFTLGGALDNQLAVKYLGGISLIIAKDFIVSGGIAFGKIKMLGTGLENGKEYVIDSPIPMRDVWSTNLFLGITYNIVPRTENKP